jgi:pyridoxamine 5'-phosphate oxidase
MPEKITFHQIRKEYANQGIDESQLPAQPMDLFRQWYQAAEENQPDDWVEANAMSLATSDKSGRVSNRYVLLKGIDDNGIRLYTNYDSDKGQQIASNPHASAAFHWAYIGRQVRLEGSVEKTGRSDSEQYFHSRPRGSQIGAAVSAQSSKLENRDELEQKKIEIEAKFDGQPIPLPDNWGGYRIVANRIEFWQGRANRMHDRIVYELSKDGSWKHFRISP